MRADEIACPVELESQIVPATRVRAGLRVLHGSALLVTIAACTPHGDDRVPAVDLEAYATPAPAAPRLAPHRTDYAPLPPIPDEATRPLVVRVDALASISTPLPEPDAWRNTELLRPGSSQWVTIRFCVDVRGRVVRLKRRLGPPELAAVLIATMSKWRYAPHRVDGFAREVCTHQRFLFKPGPGRHTL